MLSTVSRRRCPGVELEVRLRRCCGSRSSCRSTRCRLVVAVASMCSTRDCGTLARSSCGVSVVARSSSECRAPAARPCTTLKPRACAAGADERQRPGCAWLVGVGVGARQRRRAGPAAAWFSVADLAQRPSRRGGRGGPAAPGAGGTSRPRRRRPWRAAPCSPRRAPGSTGARRSGPGGAPRGRLRRDPLSHWSSRTHDGVISLLPGAAGLVADAADGQHDLGVLRVGLDLGAQPLHVDVDQPGVGGVAVAPDLLEQHLAGEHLPGLAGQADQQVELERA